MARPPVKKVPPADGDPERETLPPERPTALTAGQRRGPSPGQSTVVFSAPAENKRGLAKLVGLRGRRQGVEFALRGTELTIGRDPTNDIAISDISVSRRHARLRRVPDGWSIADAGGGNGTRVNGLTIDEVVLSDGDIVDLGGTELQFFAPPPEPAAPVVDSGKLPRRKPSPLLRVVAGAVVIVLAALVAVKLLRPRGGPVSVRSSPTEHVDQFALARKLVLAQKWEDAKAALLQAQAGDRDNHEIKRYLDAVAIEIVNQQHLDAATAAFAKQDLIAALRELKQIGNGSLVFDAAVALKVKIDAAVADLVRGAAEALAAGNLAAAQQTLDRVLAADPDQPQAIALRPKLESALVLQHASAAERAKFEAQRNAALRLERGPVGQARNLFRTGDLGGAIAALQAAAGPDEAAAAQLSASLSVFSSAYQRGRTALTARRDKQAVEQLGTAHRSAVEIGGSDGAFAVSTGRLLAQLHDQLGIAARSGRSLNEAYRHFAAALEANPGDSQAKEQLHRLETEADELYQTAYGQMHLDPSAAARNFRLVLTMTGPGSSLHKRAQERLSQIGSDE